MVYKPSLLAKAWWVVSHWSWARQWSPNEPQIAWTEEDFFLFETPGLQCEDSFTILQCVLVLIWWILYCSKSELKNKTRKITHVVLLSCFFGFALKQDPSGQTWYCWHVDTIIQTRILLLSQTLTVQARKHCHSISLFENIIGTDEKYIWSPKDIRRWYPSISALMLIRHVDMLRHNTNQILFFSDTLTVRAWDWQHTNMLMMDANVC